LREIEKGVTEGRFQHHGVAYDPRKDKGTDWTTFYYRDVENRREIPEAMFLATTRGGSRPFERPAERLSRSRSAPAKVRQRTAAKKSANQRGTP
jgi:hypothetical protein